MSVSCSRTRRSSHACMLIVGVLDCMLIQFIMYPDIILMIHNPVHVHLSRTIAYTSIHASLYLHLFHYMICSRENPSIKI
ncbi:hypothetical protein [Paenibacillus hunanensis]|uniref:hypothetical protein n=1 Tax=Paenibacillus hunanensis TaxID=539262 RepID=UPI0038996AA7